MSIFQLVLLIAVTAPFVLACWAAYLHWQAATAVEAARDEIATFGQGFAMGAGDDVTDRAGADVLAAEPAWFHPARIQFNIETIDVAAEVQAAAAAAELVARGDFVRIDLAVRPDIECRADRAALRRALMTSIDTAVHATPGGQVLVSAVTLGSQVQIQVTDDGADSIQQQRESQAREASELIALQGGSVAVDVRAGRCTTVTLRLPAAGVGTPRAETAEDTPVLAEQAA